MSVFKILSTLLHFPKINIINFVAFFFLFIKIKVNDIFQGISMDETNHVPRIL